MIKFILFGIGFFLILEGLIYFFLAKSIKNFFLIISNYKHETIRTFSSVFIILGLCLIYFTIKTYEFEL